MLDPLQLLLGRWSNTQKKEEADREADLAEGGSRVLRSGQPAYAPALESDEEEAAMQ